MRLVFHPQLPELADLAGAFPNATIILNHIGRPLGVGPYAGRQDEVFADWQQGIASVAAHENVVVKLGGFGNVISGYGWHQRAAPPNSEELAETIRPWLDYCIEQFGPERCMFESNFPVDKASYSYTTVHGMPSNGLPPPIRTLKRPRCSRAQRFGRTGCSRRPPGPASVRKRDWMAA